MDGDIRDGASPERGEEPPHPGLVVLGRSLVLPAVGEEILRDLVEQDHALRHRLWEEPSLADLRLPLPIELDRECSGSHPLLVEPAVLIGVADVPVASRPGLRVDLRPLPAIPPEHASHPHLGRRHSRALLTPQLTRRARRCATSLSRLKRGSAPSRRILLRADVRHLPAALHVTSEARRHEDNLAEQRDVVTDPV